MASIVHRALPVLCGAFCLLMAYLGTSVANMDMPLLKTGYIAMYYATATGQQISKPPYFVYQSIPKCEFDVRQLAEPASPNERPVWRIECEPGTPTGPKK